MGNYNGRKMYSRELMSQILSNAIALPKPSNLPNFDIVRRVPQCTPEEERKEKVPESSPKKTKKGSKSASKKEREVRFLDHSPKHAPEIVLKYSYQNGQWSPINTEGKKQYSRSFLLEVKRDPLSMKEPTNLKIIDCIKMYDKRGTRDKRVGKDILALVNNNMPIPAWA